MTVLIRLTFGFHRNSKTISEERIAIRSSMSVRTVRTQLKLLVSLNSLNE